MTGQINIGKKSKALVSGNIKLESSYVWLGEKIGDYTIIKIEKYRVILIKSQLVTQYDIKNKKVVKQIINDKEVIKYLILPFKKRTR